MSESIQLAEGETIFQKQTKIADILNNPFLSGISAPAVLIRRTIRVFLPLGTISLLQKF